MTNQEAITKLTNIMHDDHYSWHPSILEAFGMAVDALKSAGGDCISRQAAINRIESHIRTGDELYPLTDTDKILNHAFEIAASCVYNLPSAQPTQTNTSNALQTMDCIDRQKAIEALCKAGCGSEYCGISCDDVKAIEELPSAQPELPIKKKCTICPHCDNCDVNDDGTIAQPEQQNCPYCHEDADGYLMPLEKNIHIYMRPTLGTWTLHFRANGWSGGCVIQYCPMCGRRLKHG